MSVDTTNSLDSLKKQLPELAAEALERAEEFEAAREIAPDFVDRVKAAGGLKILLTEAQGGLGGTPLDWFDMTTILAAADASTGWVCGHGAAGNAFVANIAQPSFATRALADPNVCFAWSNLGGVDYEKEEGGLRLNGRWSFETGCTVSTYIGGFVRLPPKTEGGPPHIVVPLVPIEKLTIDKVWDPVGLAGTGSHDVIVDDVFVPEEEILDWPSGPPMDGYPTGIYVPGVWVIGTCAAATHVGLARHAIDEVRNSLANKSDRATGQPLLEKPTNIIPLEEAEGLLFACRAGVEAALTRAWECGLRGEPIDKETRLQVRVAAVTATSECARIVRNVYEIAGAGAILRSGTIQRLYRDAACLTHHMSAGRDSFAATGKVRMDMAPLTWAI